MRKIVGETPHQQRGFDGVKITDANALVTAVLVKYTYYGDTVGRRCAAESRRAQRFQTQKSSAPASESTRTLMSRPWRCAFASPGAQRLRDMQETVGPIGGRSSTHWNGVGKGSIQGRNGVGCSHGKSLQTSAPAMVGRLQPARSFFCAAIGGEMRREKTGASAVCGTRC
jgi:hypothetical protein